MFLDYRNAGDFSDGFSIIYGHRMTGHLMFGDVKMFADNDYFVTHPSGVFRFGRMVYDLRVTGFATIDYDSEIYNLREFKDDRLKALSFLREKSINWRDEYGGGKLLMLSTCNKNAKLYRDVLVVEIRN